MSLYVYGRVGYANYVNGLEHISNNIMMFHFYICFISKVCFGEIKPCHFFLFLKAHWVVFVFVSGSLKTLNIS